MDRPLDGLVVVDLTQGTAGLYATMLMADAGARVIAVEPPGGGLLRTGGSPLEGDPQVGSYVLRFGRHKQSVVLDLQDRHDREQLWHLIGTADVLVESLLPDEREAFEFDAARVAAANPWLIHTSISGFGRDDVLPSPNRAWPETGAAAEAFGGIMDLLGEADCPPHRSAAGLADLYAGAMALNGTLMALFQRARTGRGRRVDIAKADCMVSLNERSIFRYALTGDAPWRGSPPSWAPFGAFRTVDGWVAIGVIGDAVWRKFCHAIEAPELLTDERLATGIDRGRNGAELVSPVVNRWLRGRTSADAAAVLQERGVPAAPVSSAADVLESDHTAARAMLVDVEYPRAGTYRVVASPIKLSGSPLPAPGRAPELGEHTDRVLQEFAPHSVAPGA